MTHEHYHTRNIRELLMQGFSIRDLRHLCEDVPSLQSVLHEIPENASKADIVDGLVGYAHRTLQIDMLLALAYHHNPARYEKHQPYYLADATHDPGGQMGSIPDWYRDMRSTDYEIGIDYLVKHSGRASGYVRAKHPSAKGDALLRQDVIATEYRGRKVKLSGYVKTKDVTEWSALWMYVIDGHNKTLIPGYESVLGTTAGWKRCELSMKVPESTELISFGAWLRGGGQIWIDDLRFEVIKDAELSGADVQMNAHPGNLDFENAPSRDSKP